MQCLAKSTVPALLHACHEARIVALQVYKQAFASRLRDAVYFDFNQDILFGDDNVVSAFSAKGERVENAIPAQEEPIRRLMIFDTQPGAIVLGCPIEKSNVHAFTFKALEKVVIQRDSPSSRDRL